MNELGIEKKLGFGLMRLPRKGPFTDIAQTKTMVDEFLDAGFSYFDTAPLYPGSEVATGKALVSRYPRDRFQLATKINAWMLVRNEAAAKRQFDTSLKRTGAQYFDCYILHSLMGPNIKSYDKFHIWDFARQLKEAGKIKHYGFSWHDQPERLDEILEMHPDVDFVQLQINYADWENPRVCSRGNYEVARAHDKPIIVMEPVKGGSLANPPKDVKRLFDEANPHASYASWAIRFAASLEGVATVLSGMSTVQHVRDNVSYMQQFSPLGMNEQHVIAQAQKALGRSALIPCTSCGYCLSGCPQNIPIPKVFEAMNMRLANGQVAEAQATYATATAARGTAESCISCGACERACTQGIDIITQLKKCAQAFDENGR